MTDSNDNGGESALPSFVAGEWIVEPVCNLLIRGDERVHLEPRVMDTLVFLAMRPGAVVTKDDLVNQVWQGRYVSDDVLTVTIYALRKALGDDARPPRFVETVPRRGYRWIAPVTKVNGTTHGSLASAAIESRDASKSSGMSAGWIRTAAAALSVTLVAASTVWMLARGPRRRHVASAEAHEAYVKGRFFLDKRSPDGWQQALDQFRRAALLDPEDPSAQAGLADAYSAMSDFGVASRAELRPQAFEAARRALALDPNSPEGLEALGRAQFLFDWNFSEAERNLQRALAADPDFMPAHQAMAWLKSARGQYSEATAFARRALQLDPVNTARYNELAWVLALSGRDGEALSQIDRATQLDPRALPAYLMKGWIYEQAGQPEQAFAAYREGFRITGAPPDVLQRIEAVYRSEGLQGYYRNWLNAQRNGGKSFMSDTWRAQLYARSGQLDRAIESLEAAYQKREGALAWINVEPSFAPLRTDPRFVQIAAHVGNTVGTP